MPASPAAVWSPASSSEPESPGSAWSRAAGGSPSAPAAVWEAGAGGSPSAPAAVFSPAADTPLGIAVSGTSAGNGSYAPGLPANGYDAWSSGSGQIYHAGDNWVIQAAGYTAIKASVAESPAGLTGWTVSLGTGQPVLVASVPKPPAVFTLAAGGSPSAPGGVFSPAGGTGYLTPPPPVFGVPAYGLYDANYQPLLNSDGTPLENTPDPT